MSFMHFETMSVVAGLDIITLSGSLGSPNTATHQTTATANAGWNFATLDDGDIEKASANRRIGSAYTVPKEDEWINNKDFVRQFWIRARHDPDMTGHADWGVVPTSGTLDTWLEFDPDDQNYEWLWTNTTAGTTVEGVIEVSIAADESMSVGTILQTGYYKGFAKKLVDGGSSGGCFTCDMLILMADGTEKPIADVIVGDLVKSYNESTGRLENARVNGVMAPRVCNIYEVELSNGNVIKTTEEHPFRTTDGKWVNIDPIRCLILHPEMTFDCEKMEAGMMLQGIDGNAKVAKIIDTGRKETVYHLYDVGPHNNFVVQGVCAHNTTVKKD